MLRREITAAGIVVFLFIGAPAVAADVESGRAAFLVCQACHSVKAGEANIGPTLYGVVGRRAGSLPGFDYSPAMKAANMVWGRKTLDAYLTNPAKDVPGNKMAFVGVTDAQDRADLIAYLSQLGRRP